MISLLPVSFIPLPFVLEEIICCSGGGGGGRLFSLLSAEVAIIVREAPVLMLALLSAKIQL